MSVNIAIDGPSGAGKSTLSRALAARLGFIYVDTGAIYRCVGLFAAEHGIKLDNAGEIAGRLGEIEVDIVYQDNEQHMQLNGADVTGKIRTPLVSKYASAVSAVPQVRAFLLDMQRTIARGHDCVMDGRDIGTVVLPEADVKIFLTASPQARARRRYKELSEKGQAVAFDEVLSDMIERDKRDTERAQAPLRQADEAVVLDTTEIDFDQSLKRLCDIVHKGLGK